MIGLLYTYKYSEVSCANKSDSAVEARPADDEHRALRLGQRLERVTLQCAHVTRTCSHLHIHCAALTETLTNHGRSQETHSLAPSPGKIAVVR